MNNKNMILPLIKIAIKRQIKQLIKDDWTLLEETFFSHDELFIIIKIDLKENVLIIFDDLLDEFDTSKINFFDSLKDVNRQILTEYFTQITIKILRNKKFDVLIK